MVERRPIVLSCSEDSWHVCLIAMNEQKPSVNVNRSAIEDVIRCHQSRGGGISRDLVIRPGRARVVLDRARLWDLVQAHGELCR